MTTQAGSASPGLEERVARLEGIAEATSERLSDMNLQISELRREVNVKFNMLLGLGVALVGSMVAVAIRAG